MSAVLIEKSLNRYEGYDIRVAEITAEYIIRSLNLKANLDFFNRSLTDLSLDSPIEWGVISSDIILKTFIYDCPLPHRWFQ